MPAITFPMHTLKKEGKYSCECGNKFKRVKAEQWTENQFNKTWLEGGAKASNEKAFNKLREKLARQQCPKCGFMCANEN